MWPIKYLLFLMLLPSTTLFAADKPTWTVAVKKLNLPKKIYSPREPVKDPNLKVQFTLDNNVLISFLEHRLQTDLVTKETLEKSGSIFVVLLLSRETGEVVRRVEWPVLGESTRSQQYRYGSRVYPLHSIGYVGIINRQLRVLDSFFNVIHDRVLETPNSGRYELIVPLYGQYFIFKYFNNSDLITEVVDSKTFKTVEYVNVQNSEIWSIWGDRLLAIKFSNGHLERRFLEKKVGASQWNDLGLTYGGSAEAKFIHNGAIVVMDSIGHAPNRKGFWFKIEGGKKSESVFKSIGISKLSTNTPIIAVNVGELSDFRRVLDLNTVSWIEAYDLSTQQIMLSTRKHTNMVDYAISPNGDSIALMTEKKIELYNVNSKKAKN